MKKMILLVILLFAFSSTTVMSYELSQVGDFDIYKDFAITQMNENQEKDWIFTTFALNPADFTYQKIDGLDLSLIHI